MQWPIIAGLLLASVSVFAEGAYAQDPDKWFIGGHVGATIEPSPGLSSGPKSVDCSPIFSGVSGNQFAEVAHR